jgi:hypothetical protein
MEYTRCTRAGAGSSRKVAGSDEASLGPRWIEERGAQPHDTRQTVTHDP